MRSLCYRGISALILAGLLIFSLADAKAQGRARKGAVQITPYKTTLIANGKDEVSIRVVAITAAGDDRDGKANDYMNVVYPEIAKKYDVK